MESLSIETKQLIENVDNEKTEVTNVVEKTENVEPVEQVEGKVENVDAATPNKKKDWAFLNILSDKFAKRNKKPDGNEPAEQNVEAAEQEHSAKKLKNPFAHCACLPKLSGGKISCAACQQKKTPRNMFYCATCDNTLFCAQCMVRDHRLHEIHDAINEKPVQQGVEELVAKSAEADEVEVVQLGQQNQIPVVE